LIHLSPSCTLPNCRRAHVAGLSIFTLLAQPPREAEESVHACSPKLILGH
jgi:hypothetical protein